MVFRDKWSVSKSASEEEIGTRFSDWLNHHDIEPWNEVVTKEGIIDTVFETN